LVPKYLGPRLQPSQPASPLIVDWQYIEYRQNELYDLQTTQTGQNGEVNGAATAARCSGIAGTTGKPAAGTNTPGIGGSPLANLSIFSVIATKVGVHSTTP